MISLSIPKCYQGVASLFVYQNSVVLYHLRFQDSQLSEVEVTPYVLGQPVALRSAMAADVVAMLAQLGLQNFERVFYCCDHAGIALRDSLERLDNLNLSATEYAVTSIVDDEINVVYTKAPLAVIARVCRCEVADIVKYKESCFLYLNDSELGLAIPTSISQEAVAKAIAQMICEL